MNTTLNLYCEQTYNLTETNLNESTNKEFGQIMMLS